MPIPDQIGLDVGLDLGSALGIGAPSAAEMRRNTRIANNTASEWAVRGAVTGAKQAGIHPLAVLGGGVGGTPVGPMQTGVTGQVSSKLRSQAEIDFLKAQTNYYNSLANNNASQDNVTSDPEGVTRPPVETKPHPSESAEVTFVGADGVKYRGKPGTPQQVYEDQIGEWADWMPETLRKAWHIFKQQNRHIFRNELEMLAEFYSKHKGWEDVPYQWRYKYVHGRDKNPKSFKFKRNRRSGVEPGRERGRAGPQPYRPKTWRY